MEVSDDLQWWLGRSHKDWAKSSLGVRRVSVFLWVILYARELNLHRHIGRSYKQYGEDYMFTCNV